MDGGMDKTRSGDRGWNDPPPVLASGERPTQSKMQATRKRLNKRVPIPLASDPAPLSGASASSGLIIAGPPPSGPLISGPPPSAPPPSGPPPSGPPPSGPPPSGPPPSGPLIPGPPPSGQRLGGLSSGGLASTGQPPAATPL